MACTLLLQNTVFVSHTSQLGRREGGRFKISLLVIFFLWLNVNLLKRAEIHSKLKKNKQNPVGLRRKVILWLFSGRWFQEKSLSLPVDRRPKCTGTDVRVGMAWDQGWRELAAPLRTRISCHPTTCSIRPSGLLCPLQSVRMRWWRRCSNPVYAAQLPD